MSRLFISEMDQQHTRGRSDTTSSDESGPIHDNSSYHSRDYGSMGRNKSECSFTTIVESELETSVDDLLAKKLDGIKTRTRRSTNKDEVDGGLDTSSEHSDGETILPAITKPYSEIMQQQERRCYTPADIEIMLSSESEKLDDDAPEYSEEDPVYLKKKCLKNCFVIGGIILSYSTSIFALINLASSLNPQTVTATTVYLFSSIIGSFISTVAVPQMGGKITMMLSLIFAIVFISMEFFPRYETLIPAAFIAGVFYGISWTVMMMYCTNTAILYARVTKRPIDLIISYSFSVFFFFYTLTGVTGNLISTIVLVLTSEQAAAPNPNDTFICGVHFCPYNQGNTTLTPPSDTTVSILLISYIGVVFLSVLLTIFCLDELYGFMITMKPESKTCTQEIISSFKMFIHPTILLLALLFVYVGIERNIVAADYYQAYASCYLGVETVGYLSMVYSTFDVIGSVIPSFLGQTIGRTKLLTFALSLMFGAHFVMMLLSFHNAPFSWFIIVPSMFGLGDGIVLTQINSLLGLLYSSELEAAYSVSGMLTVFGNAMVFAYQPVMCIPDKVYISGTIIVLSYVFYIIFDVQIGRGLAAIGTIEVNVPEQRRESVHSRFSLPDNATVNQFLARRFSLPA